MIRRKTYDKLPLQGNVYPMPTMAYIEDDFMRFNILSGQPSGVACLKPGKICSLARTFNRIYFRCC
jgi:alpha-mannosidase II